MFWVLGYPGANEYQWSVSRVQKTRTLVEFLEAPQATWTRDVRNVGVSLILYLQGRREGEGERERESCRIY